MEKLDRLGWAAESSFEAFGVAIGIRTNAAHWLDVLRPYLPLASKGSLPLVQRLYSFIGGDMVPRTHTRRLHLLYGNVRILARSAELHEVLHALRSDLNLYVAENAPRRLFVHAGAVGWRGRGIVMPGPSFSGKTMLVREFLRAGATYYSDEFAVLDARGILHPFNTALSVRTANGIKQEIQPAGEFGSSVGAKPIQIGCVLATAYRPGAKWKLSRISKGQGAMMLLANTVGARKHPSRTLSILSRAVSSAEILKSHRGESKYIVDSLLNDLS